MVVEQMEKEKRRVIKSFYPVLLGLIALFTLSLLPTTTEASYTDVPSTYRAYNEVNYLNQGDITTSSSTTHFYPDAAMTREHAAAMIGKALQFSGSDTTVRFTDVSAANPYMGYLNEAASRGIINGYKQADGTYKFEPNKTLTRGEMALMIARAFQYNSQTTNAAAIELMDKGIAAGVGKGNFGTTQLMKRGDFSVFLARAINADFRTKAITTAGAQMYVNVPETDSLNFRQGPATGYNTTKRFYTAYPVEVFYSVGDWVYAKGAGSTGFFHKNFLSTKQPTISSVTPKEPETVLGSSKKAFKDLNIIIDPGHGAHDPGAIGFGYQEKNVVLSIALSMEKYFAQVPFDGLLTRKTDVFLSLAERAKYAYNNDGDVFLSIHANALNGSAQGQETFYYASNTNVDQSKALATYVHKRMQEAWGLKDRGVKRGNYAVLRENTVPSALAEIGFIDNKTDNAYIASATRREQMAKALFLGILDYLYHYENYPEAANYYSQFGAKPSAKHY